MGIIDKINSCLLLKGISGAELSRDLGLSNSAYSQWNTGKTIPSPKTVSKIASYFNVPVAWFYDSSDNGDPFSMPEPQNEKTPVPAIPGTGTRADELRRQIYDMTASMSVDDLEHLHALLSRSHGS